MLGGRTVIMADVYMRGDLHRFSTSGEAAAGGGATATAAPPTTAISIGRYTVVATGCTLKPPSRISRGQMTYYPMRIGDNVFIGKPKQQQAAPLNMYSHSGPDAKNLLEKTKKNKKQVQTVTSQP
jgi:dynactin-5